MEGRGGREERDVKEEERKRWVGGQRRAACEEEGLRKEEGQRQRAILLAKAFVLLYLSSSEPAGEDKVKID